MRTQRSIPRGHSSPGTNTRSVSTTVVFPASLRSALRSGTAAPGACCRPTGPLVSLRCGRLVVRQRSESRVQIGYMSSYTGVHGRHTTRCQIVASCSYFVPSRSRSWTRVHSSSCPRNDGVRGSNPRVGSFDSQGLLGAAFRLNRRFGGRGVYQGSPRSSRARPADRFTDRDAPSGRVAHDVRVGAGGKAGIGVAEMLGYLVQRPPLVEQQRRAGVAQVVAAEVGDAGPLERRNPDSSPPVLPAQVATRSIREHERLCAWPAPSEVELDQLARDGREEFGFSCACRLRRGDLGWVACARRAGGSTRGGATRRRGGRRPIGPRARG